MHALHAACPHVCLAKTPDPPEAPLCPLPACLPACQMESRRRRRYWFQQTPKPWYPPCATRLPTRLPDGVSPPLLVPADACGCSYSATGPLQARQRGGVAVAKAVANGRLGPAV